MTDVEESLYLVYFNDEKKSSIATRNQIVSNDNELKPGATVLVKDGTRSYSAEVIAKGMF